MIHHFLITSSSGLVLYSKEFTTSLAQPRLVGSLLTALVEFSKKNVSLPVSHIELDNLSVAVSVSESTRIICAVFFDSDDGFYFGKLVSTELLLAFSQLYTENVENINNLNNFGDFSSRLPDILISCLGCALNELKATSFVDNALLYYGDNILANTFSDDSYYFMRFCTELFRTANSFVFNCSDKLQSITLETQLEQSSERNGTKQLLVYKLEYCLYLVLLIHSDQKESAIYETNRVIGLLEKLFNTLLCLGAF
ncbi:hypothetical protein GpartN1_g5236.t1 [Galdieria partita]|uniref:Uncharacterized protein n=1 Tax=Galdieria partita TaxID=83374 RepID=A0A9C7PZU0_9RHOD|nr:hypothetical protein GpartN1_g5236.t1 [Galdieria partita]